MQNDRFFLKHLFIPFAFLLVLSTGIRALSGQMGDLIASSFINYTEGVQLPLNLNLDLLRKWSELGAIGFFALSIYFFKEKEFKTIFQTGLIAIAALLILSIYPFYGSKISWIITSVICPNLLFFLGWACVNQYSNSWDAVLYYFGLNCAVGLLETPFGFSAMPLKSNFFANPQALLITALICLLLMGVCYYWIDRKSQERDEIKELFPPISSRFAAIFQLGLIVAGVMMITNMTNNLFLQDQVKTITPAGTKNVVFRADIEPVVIFALIFHSLSFLIGSFLIQKKGWRKTFLVAPFIGAIALALPFFNLKASTYVISEVMLNVLQYSWIFPLTQIAMVNYSKQNSLVIQASVLLVSAPLLEWISRQIQLSRGPTIVVCIATLVAMIVCVYTRTMREREQTPIWQ